MAAHWHPAVSAYGLSSPISVLALATYPVCQQTAALIAKRSTADILPASLPHNPSDDMMHAFQPASNELELVISISRLSAIKMKWLNIQ